MAVPSSDVFHCTLLLRIFRKALQRKQPRATYGLVDKILDTAHLVENTTDIQLVTTAVAAPRCLAHTDCRSIPQFFDSVCNTYIIRGAWSSLLMQRAWALVVPTARPLEV
jgi:hypothetical protein